MTRTLRAVIFACLVGTPILAATAGNAGSDSVNVATATLRNASGSLRVGRDIGVGQIVSTADDERLDLLFPDGSSLAMAPGAQAMIEAFSFDPRRGTGQLVMHLASGLFRFAGGRIAKHATATVATPAAALAIHDGIVLIRVDIARTTATVTSNAAVTVSNRKGAQVLRHPGSQIVAEAGSPPRPPITVPGAELSRAIAELEPAPRTAGPLPSAGVSEAPNAAVNALSDANTLLQKLPGGGVQPGVRGRSP